MVGLNFDLKYDPFFSCSPLTHTHTHLPRLKRPPFMRWTYGAIAVSAVVVSALALTALAVAALALTALALIALALAALAVCV